MAAAREPVPLAPGPERPGAGNGPTEVSVDAWFADVSAIDSAAQTFSANLALVLRWRDPGLARPGAGTRTFASGDVWHPPWVVANESSLRRTLPDVVQVAPDGTAVVRQRLLGSFAQGLDLHRFPFDEDTFRVHLVAPGYAPDQVAFAPDAGAIRAGLADAVGLADEVTLQDWRVTSVTARPEPYAIGPDVRIAGYAIEFRAERRAQHYVLKVMLPLLLIVMMSWAVFWIDPSQTPPRVTVSITSMLTLIAYRFAVGADVPKLPYLTLLDRFILASSVVVFLSLVEVLVTTRLAVDQRREDARRVDRLARWVFPSLFALVVAYIVAS